MNNKKRKNREHHGCVLNKQLEPKGLIEQLPRVIEGILNGRGLPEVAPADATRSFFKKKRKMH